MNIIVALLSDERLGCRARRERIVRYVMAQRIPDQVSRIYRLTGNNDTDCLGNLRMDMGSFSRLCYLLHNVRGLSDSKHVKLEEKVCFFLTVLAHHKKNRIVKFDHVRSGHTVSIYFNAVIISLIKLHPILLVTPKPVNDECNVARWKHFKGGISVNVRGVVDRNMDFVYMLPGWEGSAADGRVLRDAVNRPNGLKVPNGQYYLCDNGYMNCPGFLAPYQTTSFEKYKLLPLTYTESMILCCALLHNFIRREMEVDPKEAHVPDLDPNHQNLYADDQPADDEFVESVGPNHEWSAWRDNLANDMFTDWRIGHR
ncbi:hypothetical protein BUALT_Bualt02G0075700 [Buddleja alternifolia]|uniref:DUF8040 domain-containing protein n=1 Tax=Buddleja alternifolia TaxID=168488 RepID=A0AAV6Y6U1_9LAMI|nr:hypothetical protein BUALT_Bualt02G0075700 [Buddleja alternifolia]